MKRKVFHWIATVVMAIPIPISLITILGSIISLANIGMLSEQSYLLAFAAVTSMLLAGTYVVPYVISTVLTFRNKKLNILSFMPVFHILITALCMTAWIFLEKICVSY